MTHPPPTVADLTVRQAGRLFRSGELSPVELTRAVLDRLAATESLIHAYVVVFAEEAMAAARRAESELGADLDRGPLHGIPVAIKDIFDVRGVPTRCGSRARDDAPPAAEDAPTVARLRAGGAVLLGKTVTQEFAAGVISAPARNPWDPTRIPGGSSGGSAAAVAAGSCLAALGSDTGGSIRIPAAATGIVGLKPTFGMLDTRGVFPLSWSLDTVGPLTRTVEDAAILLDLLAGRAPTRSDEPGGDETIATDDGLRGVRIGVARPFFLDRVQPDVRSAFTAALDRFADLGAELIEAPWAEAAAARAVAFVLNRVEVVSVHVAMLRDRIDLLDLVNPDLRLRIEAGALIPAVTYVRALAARDSIKRSMARLFADHRLAALAVPTLPATAVVAGERPVIVDDAGEEAVGSGYTRLTMPFNATGQPVLALPCGFDRAGLPIGLQLVGRPFAEGTLCRIGHAYERAADWWRRRPALG